MSCLRVGVVGLGLIGRQRIEALWSLADGGRDVEVIGVVDPGVRPEMAREVRQYRDVAELIDADPDWVVIAVPHDTAETVAEQVLDASPNVLVEKPLGRGVAAAERLVSKAGSGRLFVGHNYRFMPGIAAMFEDIESGHFGEPISMRMMIGHGNAPGQEKSWKLDPVKAGGGVLIDPGIHLVDLIRVAGGDIGSIDGLAWSGFWNTGIEEEVHLLIETENVPMINMEMSLVRWRSTFRVEFNGTDGYGIVSGRGRSYGPQSYVRGRRWGWQSGRSQLDSEELVVESDCNTVFACELDSLMFGAPTRGMGPCSAEDGLENMRLLERIKVQLGLFPEL